MKGCFECSYGRVRGVEEGILAEVKGFDSFLDMSVIGGYNLRGGGASSDSDFIEIGEGVGLKVDIL